MILNRTSRHEELQRARPPDAANLAPRSWDGGGEPGQRPVRGAGEDLTDRLGRWAHETGLCCCTRVAQWLFFFFLYEIVVFPCNISLDVYFDLEWCALVCFSITQSAYGKRQTQRPPLPRCALQCDHQWVTAAVYSCIVRPTCKVLEKSLCWTEPIKKRCIIRGVTCLRRHTLHLLNSVPRYIVLGLGKTKYLEKIKNNLFLFCNAHSKHLWYYSYSPVALYTKGFSAHYDIVYLTIM